MFIIFGWGAGSTKDLGPTLPIHCPNCNNKVFWHHHKLTRWFTLFFIPVIPYETKHFLACPTCSRGIELHGAEVDIATAMTRDAPKVLQGNLNEAWLTQIPDRTALLQKAMSIRPATNVPRLDGEWSAANDTLVEAILKSNTHPRIGIDQIHRVLAQGLNINAKNKDGFTAMAIANYYEASPTVKAILINAGAKE